MKFVFIDNKLIKLKTDQILQYLKQNNQMFCFKNNTNQKLEKLKKHKYYKGLSYNKIRHRKKEFDKRKKTKSDDPSAYKSFETDFKNGKRIKTKPSKYTKQFYKIIKLLQLKNSDVKSLQSKSKITGVPLDIITKVYNKGLAAWRTGHRPGANQQQWGYARVHSFLVKGKTFYTTDRDLAIKAMTQSEKAKQWFKSIDGLCDYKTKKEKNKKIKKMDWCKESCKHINCKS